MEETSTLNKQNALTHSAISFDQGYAIRGIATIMILFVHSINEYDCYDSILSKLLLIPSFGTFGCSLFFFMSGYGMFTSQNKRGGTPTFNYLLAHLKKILIPVAIVYAINSIVLPYTMGYNDIVINHLNILTLTLPEGTDIWFIKIILFDYITTFLISKATTNTNKRLVYIFIVQSALILILHILKTGSYWYIANLCFVLGALHTTYPIFKKKYILTSIAIIVAYYFFSAIDFINEPMIIIRNIAFCTIATYTISRLRHCPKWILFMGKNSLLYYLLNIPVMWVISSNNMHFTVYFILNVIFTTALVLIYNKTANLFPKNKTNDTRNSHPQRA